jgi:hypothetical protein
MFLMLRRWLLSLTLCVITLFLAACNLPDEISPSMGEDENGSIPCDADALITAKNISVDYL